MRLSPVQHRGREPEFGKMRLSPVQHRGQEPNRLALTRDGDRLYGAVICVGWRESRAAEYELSSQIEVRRSTSGR
jgi:hypothetical protein